MRDTWNDWVGLRFGFGLISQLPSLVLFVLFYFFISLRIEEFLSAVSDSDLLAAQPEFPEVYESFPTPKTYYHRPI